MEILKELFSFGVVFGIGFWFGWLLKNIETDPRKQAEGDREK